MCALFVLGELGLRDSRTHLRLLFQVRSTAIECEEAEIFERRFAVYLSVF
jgi:hypothetical protein